MTTSQAVTVVQRVEVDKLQTATGELLAAVDELLAAAAEPVPGEVLSPAERRLIPYVLGSLERAEIARLLHVSTNTVKTQMAGLYRKLGVHNRREARLKLRAVKP